MKSLTILSPHFDDSILSCGGQIWQRIQDQQPVRVITLFAAAPPNPLPPFAAEQHAMWGNPPAANALRRAEDVVAHSRLGCEDLHHLDLPDAVYRIDNRGVPLYGSESAIFGNIHPYETSLVERLATLIRPLLLDGPVMAPMGLGNHVDHQLAHQVAGLLTADGFDLWFYEELPYVETVSEPHLANYVAESFALTENAICAKIEAMAYYRSQIPVLYGSEAEMARRIRQVAERAAAGRGFGERFWRGEGD